MLRSVSYFLAVVASLLETGLLLVTAAGALGALVGKANCLKMSNFLALAALFTFSGASCIATEVLLGATIPTGPLRGLVVLV